MFKTHGEARRYCEEKGFGEFTTPSNVFELADAIANRFDALVIPPINMNSIAMVVLTETGEQILRNELSAVPGLIKINEKREYTTELWGLFQIFGKQMYNGCKIPFKDNVINITKVV